HTHHNSISRLIGQIRSNEKEISHGRVPWQGCSRSLDQGPLASYDWLGPRRSTHGALDRSRVACDLERVEVLLELHGTAVADRPDVGDLCVAFLSLSVKPEVIVAESHNSLAAIALKDLVHVKDELIETRG